MVIKRPLGPRPRSLRSGCNALPLLLGGEEEEEIACPAGYPRLALGIPFPEKSLPEVSLANLQATITTGSVPTSMTDAGVIERRDDLTRWLIDLVRRPLPANAVAELKEFFRVEWAAAERLERNNI